MALKRRQRIIGEGKSHLFSDNQHSTTLINRVNGDSATTFGSWPKGLRGYQITDSEGHPFWPKNSRPDGDVGGPFKTRKVYVSKVSSTPYNGRVTTSLIDRVHQNGYNLPSPYDAIMDSANQFRQSAFPEYCSSEAKLRALGATAISLCNPVNPVFDASTAVAELVRDGLPTITGMQALKDRRASSIGGEYLNIQFGIKPLISDIKDLATAMRTQDKVLRQLRRDSGRQVRRSYEFPMTREVVDTKVSNPGAISSSLSGFGTPPPGTTTRHIIVEKRQWFSGAFTYYLPDSDELGGLARFAAEADKLFGVAPDIADLWNLIPWSWLVDWFVNVGPVLSNLVNYAKYGLVMPYGYMMEESIVKYQYTFSPSSSSSFPVKGTQLEIVDHTKQRVQASPFGFGVTWDGFSPGQVAILAALGLSRSR